MVFNGQLRSNEIFAALYNMIISQQVYADNIKGTYSKLVDRARVDGSLYGDTKTYYSTDVLESSPWGNDAEAQDLLRLHRPKAPETQAIVLNVFRKIAVTVDNYLSKRAWSTEGVFSQFNSVMLGWIRETKRVYDSTLYNTYIGTAVSEADRAVVELDLDVDPEVTAEEANRIEGSLIAEGVADLFDEMADVSRDFTDYKQLRSYDLADLVVVMNAKWANKIKYVELPTIFHNDELKNKLAGDKLPARYFGVTLTAADAEAGGVIAGNVVPANNKTIRTKYEVDLTVAGNKYHLFSGDLLPAGTTIGGSSAQVLYADAYKEDADVICKVMHKNSVPFMSAFETGTSFFNPLSLTETHYLIWGHNTIEYLKGLPFITIRKKSE